MLIKPSKKSDVKPHNFVLNRAAHVQLIDFGSAAPLVPGSRFVPPEYCRVPCGTCDYISPEILQAHESALVAMEMSDEETGDGEINMGEGGYGVETDWWSTGAMIYEMTYGVAPFFARDIRSTYLKIIDFRASLTFNMNVPVSSELQDLLIQYVRTNWVVPSRRLIVLPVYSLMPKVASADMEQRRLCSTLSLTELCGKPSILVRKRSLDYWLQFLTQATERHPPELHLPQFIYNEDLSTTREHHIPDTKQEPSTTASTPFDFSAFFLPSEGDSSPGLSALRTTPRSILREEADSFFIGFSWGPTADAFPDTTTTTPAPPAFAYQTPAPQTPAIVTNGFVTPRRGIGTIPCASTLRRTRTAPRRAVSDREAMRQLVDCIGLSARKKVLAAGRTPSRALAQTKSKTIRFATRAPEPLDFTHTGHSEDASAAITGRDVDSSDPGSVAFALEDVATEDESDDTSASDAPPSPSPSPRPGSAMSLLRRSATPTGSLLSHHPPSEDTQNMTIVRHSEATTTVRTTSSPPPTYRCLTGDEDTLDVLEERHRVLMGEIANIEGRVGAMKRRSG